MLFRELYKRITFFKLGKLNAQIHRLLTGLNFWIVVLFNIFRGKTFLLILIVNFFFLKFLYIFFQIIKREEKQILTIKINRNFSLFTYYFPPKDAPLKYREMFGLW